MYIFIGNSFSFNNYMLIIISCVSILFITDFIINLYNKNKYNIKFEEASSNPVECGFYNNDNDSVLNNSLINCIYILLLFEIEITLFVLSITLFVSAVFILLMFVLSLVDLFILS